MKFLLEPSHELPGLNLLQSALPDRFSEDGQTVVFEKTSKENGFSIKEQSGRFVIQYNRPCNAYRALGLLLAGNTAAAQTCSMDSLGVMIDLSRNGVLKVEALEALFRSFALMGVNSVQLYMEDVYQLPGEPFFGYGRGAYSPEELRRIDDYGHALDIEVIPCIQTLGHLEQILQWPAYAKSKDVNGVLMIGEEATYDLIRKMLHTLKTCFRSKRIHIGMDEAHGVGTGNYLTKNGWRRPFDILNEHLRKVVQLCRESDLNPMIWSDMYFRIGSKTHDYYDRETVIPQDVSDSISPDVDLVYWDYYHADPAFYENWIQKHRQLGKEPIFAAGGWNWGRFWGYWPRTKESVAAGMKAAREQKLRDAFITIWGDNGAEYHPFSILMLVQYFAEWAYTAEPDMTALERQFAVFSPDVKLSTSILASGLDEVPAVKGKLETDSNFSKWILWQDPILEFLNKHIFPDLPEHYQQLAKKLQAENTANASSIAFAANIARAVALKSRLHLELRPAYKSGDSDAIQNIISNIIPELTQEIQTLAKRHHSMWHEWNKPFGWEVLEARYATVLSRLNTLKELLERYQKNPEMRIPEFEYEIHPVRNESRPERWWIRHGEASTPSAIK